MKPEQETENSYNCLGYICFFWLYLWRVLKVGKIKWKKHKPR